MTLQEYTDDLLAIIVVSTTVGSYFVGIDVPTEPMMLVLGYFFGKRAARVVEGGKQ